ncbi:hypothetical protein COB11_08165 [Candidatus Aerophobetes bacterium]|uniref:Methylated-DNA--protein-cysteine methyltransferase n=1 Tax=Aerophobetes bacterium TaxID=2030807 RepID=A0A2A4YAM8_UNCAE|nr:MAG: hypothetical protein COB11_08165 [Candidatus Aerophobetes bacterium]
MYPHLKYYLAVSFPLKLRIYLTNHSLKKIKLERSTRDQVECIFYPESSPTDAKAHELIEKTLLWMQLYFSRKDPGFTPPLEPFATEFSRSVLSKLSETSFGSVLTYKELGTLIDKPGAARAVGTALHKNPYALIIPCHRVVSKKDIGGFAYPIEIKKLLLAFEKGSI